METKHASSASVELKGDAEGHLEAVFSTFDVVDSVGDIVVKSAFTDGQPVPLVWAHDWSRPIGKGVVKVEPSRAVFKGDFFMDTTDGLDAYRTVKAMGALQEFSWGFQILDAEPAERDGMPVRIITKAEVFEVSPVLVGANRETYTLSVKGKRRLSRGQIEAVITTLTALLGDDAAEALSDDPAGDPAGTDAGDPLMLLAARVAELKAADDDALLAARDDVVALMDRLAAVRGDLEALTKRADLIGSENPRELFRQFTRLQGLYAPVLGQMAG